MNLNFTPEELVLLQQGLGNLVSTLRQVHGRMKARDGAVKQQAEQRLDAAVALHQRLLKTHPSIDLLTDPPSP